jgi:hypothetical protein
MIVSSYDLWWNFIEIAQGQCERGPPSTVNNSGNAVDEPDTVSHDNANEDDQNDLLENEICHELLDIAADDDDDDGDKPAVGEIIKQLITAAKRHKSFTALFKLQAVNSYLELVAKYSRNPKIKNPRTRASQAIAKGVGRGPYFAKQIRHLTLYIERFRTLPPPNAGKHHAHPSLLNNERVLHAVHRYLTVIAVGEVSVFFPSYR